MNSYLVYKSSKYVIAKLVNLLLQSVYESDVYKLYRYCLTNSLLLLVTLETVAKLLVT